MTRRSAPRLVEALLIAGGALLRAPRYFGRK
jgi:hypothetical protein